MRKILIMALMMLMLAVFTACGSNMKVISSSKEYTGQDYRNAVSDFESIGFVNVKAVPAEDLKSEDAGKEDTIKEISIDGTTEFKMGDKFPKEAEIIITYHKLKKVLVPLSSKDIQDYEYKEIGMMFKKAGFPRFSVKEEFDLDPDEISEKYINEVKIDGKSEFIKDTECPFDAVVEIICHRPYEKFNLNLNIECVENMLFNRYNVDIYIDSSKIITLKHGMSTESNLRVKKGSHTLSFAEEGSILSQGSVEISDIESDIDASFRLECENGKVSVTTNYIDRNIEVSKEEVKLTKSFTEYHKKNYKDVKSELEEMGFTNVKTEPIYDLYFGVLKSDGEVTSVTINGSEDSKKGDVLKKDAEILITYHTFSSSKS